MRIRLAPVVFIATIGGLMAEPVPPAAAPASSARETALENLLSERRSNEAFDACIAAARKAGVSEQAVLEARFLFHVDRGEDAAIAAMLPDFLKHRDDFKPEDSAVFGVKEDWLAVVEYVQAIDALGKGDKSGFKKHITEAFWLGPRQAAAFAPHIERLRLEEAMASVKIDFASALTPLAGGDPVGLGKLMDGKKALLLHFWSPLSSECEASIPDFVKTAGVLQSNGIAVASLVPPAPPESLARGRTMVLPHAAKPCGAWLVDSADKPLSRELRIQNLPNMVIVSPEGGILFNGDPTDAAFWDVLKKIDARIVRPESSPDDVK